jgi:hypothetical protein
VRRNAALFTLLVIEAAVIALAVFFQLGPRAAILAAFEDYGTTVPVVARLALSSWLLPCAIGAAGLATLVGLVAPLGRRRRTTAVGTAVVIVSVALMFAIAASFQAIFDVR